MNWNWDHLRYFLAVAEHGTLSLAADSMGVSHSTVLRRIRAFEDQLNARLFDHTQSGYKLTPAGHVLHNEAVKMQGAISAIARDISGANVKMQGEIVIATTDTIAHCVLPKMLALFNKRYPEVCFTLKMGTGICDLANREADIAIRTGKSPSNDLIGKKVADVHFSFAATRRYAEYMGGELCLSPGIEHRFILLEEQHAPSVIYASLDAYVNNHDHITYVNNFITAAALARESIGIALLPSYMLVNDPDLIKLDTHDPLPHNHLWVLCHKDLRETERFRVIRQYFYEQFNLFFNCDLLRPVR